MKGAREGGAGRGVIAAWCLFDFANSAFTTVIVTSVFSVYFVRTVVPAGGISAELLWSLCSSASLLIAAFLSPLLGALADARGWKRRFLIASSLACILPTALLARVGSGDVAAAMLLFIVANVGFELGYVFYNGFLPEIAPPGAVGRISGAGWATGYIGGLLSLATALVPIQLLLPPGATGEQTAAGARVSFLLVAVHFLAFSLPAFVTLRDRPVAGAGQPFDFGLPFRRIAATFRRLDRYREAWKFILASLVYNDGVATIFFFAGIYMDRALGFSPAEIVLVVLLINIPSAIGSFAFGFVNDRIGGKKTILITLVLLILTVLGIALTAPPAGASAAALSRARVAFWILSMLAGLGIGANQSASRGLMSVFIPEDRHAEFFGFFIFSGKLSSVLAPLTYGVIAQATGSSVLAISSVAAFLTAGTLLLLTVDEREGIRQARAGLPSGA